jgi:hypothetical protein
MPPVIVNLDVNIDASGSINVFTQAPTALPNMIVATAQLSAADFYKGAAAGSSLLQFQGVTNSSAPLDDIVGTYNAAFAGSGSNKSDLAGHLHTILTAGALTASAGSNPFGSYPAGPYRNYTSFGELALAAYAHYVFGHVDATAAIDNDTVFINKMNGTATGEGQLGIKLAEKVFTEVNPTAVVKQVLGQDASRALGVDNDANTPSGLQNLAFLAGDKVYMSITLDAPTVTIAATAPAAATGLPLNNLFPGSKIKYNIEITLN